MNTEYLRRLAEANPDDAHFTDINRKRSIALMDAAIEIDRLRARKIEYQYTACEQDDLPNVLEAAGDTGWLLVSGTPAINIMGIMNVLHWQLIFARPKSDAGTTKQEGDQKA